MIHRGVYIHPKAHVHETCQLGPGTKVWQFASLVRNTIMGSDCVVAPYVCLDGPIFGDRCIVSCGVDMGPGFEIGNDVFIGPNVVICNDAWPRTHKEGFDYASLRTGEVVCVRIHDGASIGANAVVLPGVTIGSGAMIAAGAVVTSDVPPNHLYPRSGPCRKTKDEGGIKRVRQT